MSTYTENFAQVAKQYGWEVREGTDLALDCQIITACRSKFSSTTETLTVFLDESGEYVQAAYVNPYGGKTYLALDQDVVTVRRRSSHPDDAGWAASQADADFVTTLLF